MSFSVEFFEIFAKLFQKIWFGLDYDRIYAWRKNWKFEMTMLVMRSDQPMRFWDFRRFWKIWDLSSIRIKASGPRLIGASFLPVPQTWYQLGTRYYWCTDKIWYQLGTEFNTTIKSGTKLVTIHRTNLGPPALTQWHYSVPIPVPNSSFIIFHLFICKK